MMRLLVVSALVAFAAADVSHLFNGAKSGFPRLPVHHPHPVAPGQVVDILRSESNIDPSGSYQYSYESADGISAQQQGQQKPIGQESGNVAQGSYQYTSPEGVPVVVQYIADENGFQPSSDVLPTSPPIPAAILKSIDYNAAHPEPQQGALPINPFGRRFRRAVFYY